MIVALLATWATLSSTEIGTHVGPLHLNETFEEVRQSLGPAPVVKKSCDDRGKTPDRATPPADKTTRRPARAQCAAQPMARDLLTHFVLPLAYGSQPIPIHVPTSPLTSARE